MGFTMMEAFMDSVTVESKPGSGTKVTMTKLIGEGRRWSSSRMRATLKLIREAQAGDMEARGGGALAI